ncbi:MULTISPECIES: ABC transporter permease [Oligella]|uniref:ABC transporter permease n=2 Tax=Oligella urethralis TaxID=90245 RepID=A0A095YY35_9BURK|nr:MULTISPECIES: ABC transporter permease [Oligella]KGF27280.1 ABC transporter permease [Oligella urethralis DNF00040]MDK6202850.1 ABC transporter permease [Oligella urethralis]OFS87083.1 ABC transporter permease [Oligella sp. HMSC05A10]OFV50656.1 ABC transporter permease [Oligella sp. HMSC09E12]WOS38694.1 hypothetical protein RP300_02275 [Oligella urethralis]
MSKQLSAQQRIKFYCLLPAFIVFCSFWLIPMIWLVSLPAQEGWQAYFAVLTNVRYLQVMLFTLILSVLVTILTLIISVSIGIFFARNEFFGKRMMLSLLTLPLSFPGVIIGFFFILIGGRQGLFADLTNLLGFGKISFAYGVTGLFLAYLYFSLPRSIATFEAAAQTIDIALEEAVRSLAGTRWLIVKDVWIPELLPSIISTAAIVFSTSMGAFGTAFTLASRSEVLPITIYNEFTNYANFTMAASLSIALGLVTWLTLFVTRRYESKGVHV